MLVGGKAYEIKRERSLQGELHMVIGSARYAVDVQDPRSLRRVARWPGRKPDRRRSRLLCPERSFASWSQKRMKSRAGQGVIVMEAMKMQNEMKSPKDGNVQKILAAEGSAVNAGDTLAIIG